MAYTPDGSKLLVIVGDAILIYRADTDELLHTIRGYHKENIYCIAVSRNGERIATGGVDKKVIIWTPDFKPKAKYQCNDTVQCMEFDPLTGKVDIHMVYIG